MSELVFSGLLTDDAGEPLPLQPVTIRIAHEASPSDPAVAEALLRAYGCDGSSVRVSAANDGLGPVLAVSTDDAGRFCFRAQLAPDRYLAKLAFAGTELVDGAEKELAFDLGRRSLGLRFDPPPRTVAVDAPHGTFDVLALVDDDGAPRVAPGLVLQLANETEELGRAVTDGSGRARFLVPGSKLGPPGVGELRVSFTGDADTAPASEVVSIERRVHVAVRVPAADRGELAPGVPEDGLALVADVSSSLGPVEGGAVEARVGDVVVGAAPVEGGLARLTLTFAAQGSEALVRLRYVPSSPWYEPIGEPTIALPIRPPSLVSKAPMLLAGLAVLAFFLLGRTARKTSEPEPRATRTERQADGAPRLEVLRPAKRGARGWAGRLVDAHDGVPVRGRVWIERGTFKGRSVIEVVETDGDGRFTLPDIGAVHGDEIIAAEARLHARYTQPLPPAGELVIALAQRRRALLDRLVRWARRRGEPFDARPEPTPGHVRRAASGEPATVRWAEALERAVFGPAEIDAQAEEELDRLAPGGSGDPPMRGGGGDRSPELTPPTGTEGTSRPT